MSYRNLMAFPFTEEELERLKRMLFNTRIAPVVVAETFNVRLKDVLAIKRERRWSRYRQQHNVAEAGRTPKMMSITEIAMVAGLSRVTIYMRLAAGVTGPALLARKHMLPRKKKGAITERLEVVRGIKPRLVRPTDGLVIEND